MIKIILKLMILKHLRKDGCDGPNGTDGDFKEGFADGRILTKTST